MVLPGVPQEWLAYLLIMAMIGWLVAITIYGQAHTILHELRVHFIADNSLI